MDIHQSRYRARKHMAHIKTFGTAMHGSHPELEKREFYPLECSRAWRQFEDALQRALDYSWRTRASLYP